MLTRGYVGKIGLFSRPMAAKLIRVPKHHGIAKYAMPPITYPGTTARGEAEKAFTKKLVSIWRASLITYGFKHGNRCGAYNDKTEIG